MYHLLDNISRRLRIWKPDQRILSAVRIDAGLLDQLRRQRQSLLDLSQGVEGEFCSLGGQLQKMSEQSGEITSLSACLREMTLGQNEDGALQFADRLFKKSVALIEASDEEYTSVFQYLLSFGQRLDTVCGNQAMLQRVVVTFTSIILMFKMEAESLPPDGRRNILSLAANIDSLCQRLRETIDQRFAQLMTTRGCLQKTVRELTQRVAERRQDVIQRKSAIQSHLRTLQATLQSSGTQGTSVSKAARYITDHIGKIVVAVQYHDISRQKLDHVAQAVEEFCALAEKVAGHRHDAQEDCELLGYLHEVLAIQVRQLGAATEELSNAGRTLASNMQGVVACTVELAKDASFASHAAGADDGNGIIDAFLSEITAINLFVACGAEINEALMETIRPVGDLVSDFTSLTRKLSMQIRVTAINAQVQASHWLQGGALDMLAERTSATADQTIKVVDEISGQLRQVLANVEALDQRLSGFLATGQKEQQILQEEACTATSKLHTMRTEFAQSIQRIGQLQATLSADTEPLLRNMNFPQRVDACAAQVTAAFSEIIDRTITQRQRCGDSHTLQAMVEQLTQRYTMDHERVVHRSATVEEKATTPGIMRLVDGQEEQPAKQAESPADATAPDAASPANGAADLGGNVELF